MKKTLTQRVEDLEKKLGKIHVKKTYIYPSINLETTSLLGRTNVGFTWICSCGKSQSEVERCEHLEISFED